MPLVRILEENDVSPDVRRLFDEIRLSLDSPFLPTLFKLLAGAPDYLRTAWDDLGPVVRSHEFQTATKAMEEFINSLVVTGGWRFHDQRTALAGQKFSANDVEQLAALVATFSRVIVRLTLFVRLLQRGYSGGQRGRITPGKQASALSRLITVHVPKEEAASLRVWLLYSDIRRTLGSRHVNSMFRMLSPFPGYLAAVWMDTKKCSSDPGFQRARDEISKRATGLVVGLPVRDHRASGRRISAEEWRAIEETVDSYARLLPQFALISSLWWRGFGETGRVIAA